MTDDRGPARAMIGPLAQTSVQLFQQLERSGIGGAHLRGIRTAYGAAMALFAGRVHPTGKPYLAHCAGAASALAHLGAPVDLVAAALIHGAYRWGDFGPWRVYLPLKRRQVRRIVGRRSEEYVYEFHMLPWSPEAVATLSGTQAVVAPAVHAAVLLRLASELDNVCDGAVRYRPDAEQRRKDIHRKAPFMIAIAEQLGFPALGCALASATEEAGEPDVPAALHWQRAGVVLIPPASARRRFAATLTGAIVHVARRIRTAHL